MAEQTDTISRSQLEALKAGIRAAAEANPAGKDKGRRCAEITRSICSGFGSLRRLADIPAKSFPSAMKAVSGLAIPPRERGPFEAGFLAAKGRLADALGAILQARNGIASFRHDAETLIVPFKAALGVDGKAHLEGVVQDSVGCLLAMPFLQMEHDLDRMHEWLNVLGAKLPAIGRAVDERNASTAPPADAAD